MSVSIDSSRKQEKENNMKIQNFIMILAILGMSAVAATAVYADPSGQAVHMSFYK